MHNTTLHRYLTSCLLLLAVWANAQDTDKQKQYPEIPAAYLSHPELGTTTHSAALHEVAYELLQDRTAYTRTFMNTNKTKTTVRSSTPLHYKANDGQWHTLDYTLSQKPNSLVYPAQNPFFELRDHYASLNLAGQHIQIDRQARWTFVSHNAVVKAFQTLRQPAAVTNGNTMIFKNVAPQLDQQLTLYHQALKYNYTLNSADLLPTQFDALRIEDAIELPRGYTIRQEPAANGTTRRLVILNHKGETAMVFQQPIITDSKTSARNQRPQPLEGAYQLVKLNDHSYKITILVDGTWLRAANRVYPIHIDPVVTLTNPDVVNSCFTPAYEQSTLQVDVPAGETILSANISYDFVAAAGSGAYMSDQKSYVSGPAGQTPVTYGVGNTEGTHTYSITDSPIANVTSTGQVDFTFHCSRTWGGSGCDAAFNFVDRREVTVTYGTIDFGDGPIYINEYSASNRNFNDGFGRTEDWIELYNASPDTYFNLAGYYLSNNINNPTKWQIQDGTIPPNSRVLVYCSDRDISSGTVLHASFDLSQTDGDEVVLADPNGVILESHTMFVTQTNHSYGRTTDGAATWSVFKNATPGTANTGGYANYTTKPTLSIAPGRYSGPITVSMASSGANEQIRYTTNGATPTLSSPLYTGPISVAQSKVVRARAFSTLATVLPGFIETNSYFINETSTIPVVSISGDADLSQLLGGTQNEPTGYFEYFESNGAFVDETMGDFDKHGNDSWVYDQRGIDFIARDDHGYKKRLEHQFFDTSSRTNFKRLILKAAGSDNYPGQEGSMHMRDVFVQKLSELSGLDLDERRSTFVSLFVNGQYWGIYDLREKVDDNQYTDYYYGQDYKYRDSDDYIQYIKTWGSTYAEFGNQPTLDAWQTLTDFVQNNDMSVEANFNYVDSQLNINSLIDYFVLNSYMVNRDWLNWNTSWWRGTDPSGGALKWRYALWDMDGVLGHYTNYTGLDDTSANADPCQAETIPVGVGHTQTIGKLINENPGVRQRYITRYADLLNTHLSCPNVTALFDSIVAAIAPEMPRQIQRWGGDMATWEANVQEARDFLLTRCSQTISTGLVDCYDVTGPYTAAFEVEPVNTGKIRMNSELLAAYPFNAEVFGNIDTLLKAEPNEGYQFDHWEVNGATISPDATNAEIVLQIAQATSVIAHFSEVLNSEQALYYWHFNTLQTPQDVVTIQADYSQVATATPVMTYTGSGPRDIDAFSTGSIVNIHLNQPSGKGARVRNPADGRTLVFDLPTTGYKNIKFAYAAQRSGGGQLSHQLSYSVDGTTFTQAGLSQNLFNVATDYALIEVDFSALTAVNNNPNFKIQIAFAGNVTGDSGNNRFDNITLKGVEDTLGVPVLENTTYQVFPNPFTSDVKVRCSAPIADLYVYDLVGKKVWQQTGSGKTAETMDLSALNRGVYLLKIRTAGGFITHKLVRE
ncbi:CotH kinase family protein [Flavobacterium sp.]|uniref:CotH kinase family protein n=1 Tax=Flavobacterium sp. TaxID=239 RepID=UPI002620CD21|nr:CotH kinase family protein [Flavobacterium sp.]